MSAIYDKSENESVIERMKQENEKLKEITDLNQYYTSQIQQELERLIGSLRIYNFMASVYPEKVREKASWLIQELLKLKNQLGMTN